MFYKNTSYSAKTFYGVTFQPGEIKEVPGYVNSKFMIIADKPVIKQEPIQQKPSSEKPKKETLKPEEKKPEKASSKPDDKKS